MPISNFTALFQQATGWGPYPWQAAVALDEHLPEVIRVPTGAGKTEGAMLAWLWRRRHANEDVRRSTPRRLVYCLPMRVLVEQTVGRIRRELDAAGAADVAVHQLMGGAVARDWWLRPEDDVVVVGTLDQLVSRALMRGYGVSRYAWPIQFGLLHTDALWVYDEVQLMGEALVTSAQLDAFRGLLPPPSGPCAQLWMSATVESGWLQTVDRRRPQRVLTVAEEDRRQGLAARLEATKQLRRVPSIDADTIVAAHRSGTLTLVVLNTVRAAQDLARRLRRLKRLTAEIVLVHARYRPDDRAAAVDALVAPVDPDGAGRIVVATQVVEAGIDVDASVLVTEAAPWASLVQRFGRCNRAGLRDDAHILWAPPARPLPYPQQEIEAAAHLLDQLEGRSVGPDELERLDAPLAAPASRFTIRRRDFVGLFDTAPDVSGLDLDVQRFIRDGDDLTVALAWRELGSRTPAASTPALGATELCPVPIGAMRTLLEKRRNADRTLATVWRYDTLDAEWRRVAAGDLRPGDRLVADCGFGCYDPRAGFDEKHTAAVLPVGPPTPFPEEGVDSEQASVERGAWLTVAEHTDGVCAELEAMLAELAGTLAPVDADALRSAARWHDRGKAHPVFQQTMRTDASDLPPWVNDGVALAKRIGRARHVRHGFRHELASLLAYLAEPEPDPLVAYLVASHHGRVRLSARSLPTETRPPDQGTPFVLGCWQDDRLPGTDLGGGVSAPATTVDLAPLALGHENGSTYTDLALGLLDRLGPYRLAYLEALLRIADVRRSISESAGG